MPRTIYLVPAIIGGAPEEMHKLIAWRQQATITGRCPLCGENQKEMGQDYQEVGHRVMEHDDDCPVSDPVLIPLLQEFVALGGVLKMTPVIAEE